MLVFKDRYYKLEKKSNFKQTDKHPLQKSVVATSVQSKIHGKSAIKSSTSTKESFVDPLDPLSRINKNDFSSDDKNISKNASKDLMNIEPWSSKRLSILTTYTTSEKLSIISSFLSAKPNEDIKIITKSTSTSLSEKVKNRMEQLDTFDDDMRETSNLSVQQFTDKINELNQALKLSWNDGQRVKSLQIVIQTTKLLSETSVLQFFPSKFVLVTDLVDSFANLVYDRLKSKSSYISRGSKIPIALPDDFRENQVPDVAKETAKNWFYKVASIRELVARLYVEAALLPCYKYFDASAIGPSLMRLMKICRGIGDPLLATYARAYVARVGITLQPNKRDYLQLAFRDTLASIQSMRQMNNNAGNSISSGKEQIRSNNNNNQQHMPYLRLFVPAVDWILQCLCAGATYNQLDDIMSQVEAVNNPLLVHAALCSLQTDYIKKKPIYFAGLIQNLPDSSYPRYTMYRQLGACVSMTSQSDARSAFSQLPKAQGENEEAMKLLKVVWKFIGKLSEPRHFLECADAWTEFLALNFDHNQIGRFLSQIVKEMQRDADYRGYSNQLLSILNKIINCNCDFQNLVPSSEFVQFLSLFDKENLVIEARQMVLETYFTYCTSPGNGSAKEGSLSDHMMIQACVRILREMHDSLNSLSIIDNRRTVSRLTLQLLSLLPTQCEPGQVEQQLDLLTQFRATLCHNNTHADSHTLSLALVERANTLAMRVRSLRPSQQHSEGSAAFVRACLAFSYITVASVTQPDMAVRLYTATAQVAIVNGCLGQAEACLKEAIQLISKLEPTMPSVQSPNRPTGISIGQTERLSFSTNQTAATVIHSIPEMAANIASTLLMCIDIGTIVNTDSNNLETSDQKQDQQLYLLKGLINAVNLCPALRTDPSIVTTKSILKGELYIKFLMLLAAFSQPEYIYHGGKTDANDRIYGGGSDPGFQTTISELFGVLITRIRSLNIPKLITDLKIVLDTLLIHSTNQNQGAPDWMLEIMEMNKLEIVAN